VIVVDDETSGRSWAPLGADSTLPANFDRRALLDALAHTRLIGRADVAPRVLDLDTVPSWRGKLVMICGTGGTGTSIASMALAQALGADVRNAGMIALADFARHAEQGILHDADDVVPGVQEVVEAHRHGHPSPDDVRSMTFAMAHRGYHLLIGLRRASAWSTLRPRAVEAALVTLCSAFRVVVCDCDGEVEGEAEGGSVDVEERNALARATAIEADVVFVVGGPGVKGTYALARLIGELLRFGVRPGAIVPVVNRAARGRRSRSEVDAALELLLPARTELRPTVFIPERKVEEAIRDGALLPTALGEPLVAAYRAAVVAGSAGPRVARTPTPIAAGALGTGSDPHGSAWDPGLDDGQWATG
jgi:hypothetical protein